MQQEPQDKRETVDASNISNIRGPSKPDDTPRIVDTATVREPSTPQDTPETVDASNISNKTEPSKPDTPRIVDAATNSDVRELSTPQDTRETVDASNISNMREPAKPEDTPHIVREPSTHQDMGETVDSSKIPEQPAMQHASHATDTMQVPSPLKALLVAVLVAAGIIAITWSLSGPRGEQTVLDQTLKETRAKLTATSDELKAVRESKASADNALAEAQAKLTVEQEKRLMAEKVVADVKAVLANIPSSAPPNEASRPTEPTSEPSPK
jgi:hypothetical protein